MNRVLITDLDDTLYSFVDFFAPSFRGMIHALSAKTGISEERLKTDCKRVYEDRGSIEYPLVVQEMDSFKNCTRDEIKELAKTASGAFSRVREKRLNLFPGVKQTLSWLREHGVIVVGVSNTRLYKAERRLQQLNIEHLFSGLVAVKDFSIPDEIEAEDNPGNIPFTYEVSLENKKPNNMPYSMIIDEYCVDRGNYWVIGDSPEKDLKPGKELGIHTVWFQDGLNFSQKNIDTLLDITHWSNSDIESAYNCDDEFADVTISKYSELKSIIPTPEQLELM